MAMPGSRPATALSPSIRAARWPPPPPATPAAALADSHFSPCTPPATLMSTSLLLHLPYSSLPYICPAPPQYVTRCDSSRPVTDMRARCTSCTSLSCSTARPLPPALSPPSPPPPLVARLLYDVRHVAAMAATRERLKPLGLWVSAPNGEVGLAPRGEVAGETPPSPSPPPPPRARPEPRGEPHKERLEKRRLQGIDGTWQSIRFVRTRFFILRSWCCQ